MSVVSKYFYKAVENCTCAELMHAGAANCWESTLWNLSQTITGCCKYVFPIAILPLLMRIPNVNLQACKQSVMMFLEYSLASWIMGGFALTFICMFYHIFGKFYYLTILFLPALCSSSMCTFLLSEKLIKMFAHGLLTIIFEISIARGNSFILKVIRNSKVMRTLAFMFVNSFLLHALRQKSAVSNLWFLQPIRQKKNRPIKNATNHIDPVLKLCQHKYNCYTFIAQDVRKYLILGLCIEVVRSGILHYRQIQVQPWRFLKNIYRYVNCDLTAFLVTYTAVYRSLNCLLIRYTGSNNDLYHSFAAFVAGGSFYLYPITQLLCHALVTAIEQFWENFNTHSVTSDDRGASAIAFFSRLPISRIFYPFGFAYLLHVRAFEPWLAPPVLKKLMNLTTNFKDSKILLQFYEKLLG